MRLLFLIALCAIASQVVHAESQKKQNEILERKPRFIQDWLPFRAISRFFSWWTSDDDIHRSDSEEYGKPTSGDTTQSTVLSLRLLNPLRTLVTRASSAATNALTGMRNRVSSTLTSFSDYLSNGITYAKDLSPYSQDTSPEYAKGQEIPRSPYGGVVHHRRYDSDIGSANGKFPEEVYHEYTGRVNRIGQDRMRDVDEDSSKYDKYYQIYGTSRQLMDDYEQLMENEKKESDKTDPLINLTKMFEKIQKAVKNRRR